MARRTGPDTCSFCGKHRDQTRRLIAGPHGVYICADCVNVCNEILAGDQRPTPTASGAMLGMSMSHEARSRWGSSWAGGGCGCCVQHLIQLDARQESD
jgi:hypothetical protein